MNERFTFSFFCCNEVDKDIANKILIKEKLIGAIVDANKPYDVLTHCDPYNSIIVLNVSKSGKEESILFQKIRKEFLKVGRAISLRKYDMYDAEEYLKS